MFDSQQQFTVWLHNNLDEIQYLSFDKLDEVNKEKLYDIYQEGSDLKGNYDLENVLLNIGKLVFKLMELTKTLEWVGSDKKSWVMANTIAFSYLLDNGIDGTEDNIHKDIKGFEFLAEEPNALQEKLVKNQVEQAIEESYLMIKRVENEQIEFNQTLAQFEERRV